MVKAAKRVSWRGGIFPHWSEERRGSGGTKRQTLCIGQGNIEGLCQRALVFQKPGDFVKTKSSAILGGCEV